MLSFNLRDLAENISLFCNPRFYLSQLSAYQNALEKKLQVTGEKFVLRVHCIFSLVLTGHHIGELASKGLQTVEQVSLHSSGYLNTFLYIVFVSDHTLFCF